MGCECGMDGIGMWWTIDWVMMMLTPMTLSANGNGFSTLSELSIRCQLPDLDLMAGKSAKLDQSG